MTIRSKVGWLIVALVAVVGTMGFLAADWDVSAAIRQTINRFRDAGPAPFFLAMAVLPAVGFPLSAFTVAAGPVFGPTLGVTQVILWTILATSVNVALSYWIAARAVRPLMVRLLAWLGYRLPEIQAHRAWSVTLLVRIVPGPPFFLQSYLLALARAPFSVYMAVSALVPACYLTATIILGDALVRRDPWAIGSAVALFIVAGAVLHMLRRRLSPPLQPAPLREPDSP
jgi:uncharacterized membrane protein YdjX (TVP38/TMEM64 family)